MKYFNICLECLFKIVAAKTKEIKAELTTKFIRMNLVGFLQFFNNIYNKKNISLKVCIKVVQCIDQFLNFFDQCSCDDLERLQIDDKQNFKAWVLHIFNLPIIILNSDQLIDIKNQLLKISLKVMESMKNQLLIKKIDPNSINVNQIFQNFNKLFQNFISLLGETPFKNLQDKPALQCLKIIAKAFPVFNLFIFRQLKRRLFELFSLFEKNQVQITNIILFLTHLLESEEIFYESMNTQAKSIQHSQYLNVLKDIFMAIFEPTMKKRYYSKKITIPLSFFYVFFLKKLTNRTLPKIKDLWLQPEKMQAEQQKKQSPIFFDNILFQLITNQLELTQQQFWLAGLTNLWDWIQILVQENLRQFLLDCICKVLSNLKKNLKRSEFYDENFYQQWGKTYRIMLKLSLKLAKSQNDHMMKYRIQLFKVIFVCLDHSLDQYQVDYKQVILTLKQTIIDQKCFVIYDLTGILYGIQSETIFNDFLTRFCAEINYGELLEGIYLRLQNNQSYLKDILLLTYLFFECKQYKESYQIAPTTYLIFCSNLPFWCMVLDKYGCKQQKLEIIEELYPIFETIMADRRINLSVAVQQLPAGTRQFLNLMFNHLVYYLDVVQKYPEMIPIYCDTIHKTFNNLKSFVYSHEDVEIPQKINILINKLMQKLANSLQSITSQEMNYSTMFFMYLDFFGDYFKFLKQSIGKKQLIHQKYLPALCQLTQLRWLFMATIFMLVIHFESRKDDRNLDLLADIAQSANQCYKFTIELKNDKGQLDFEAMIKNGLEKCSNLQLKEWFNNRLHFSNKMSVEDQEAIE